MRITMFDYTGDVAMYSVRLLTALLKQHGHTVRLVFVAPDHPIDERSINALGYLLDDTDLAMMSVYSAFLGQTIRVTEQIHRHHSDVPVIWGGPHCISAPELSLRYADGVCFAEGEQAVIDLTRAMESGEEWTDVASMAFCKDGRIIINPVGPALDDLDSLPFADYSLRDNYILRGNLYEVNPRMMMNFSPRNWVRRPQLAVLATRGCPHVCTYCNNIKYIQLYDRIKIRKRSIDHTLGEIETILEQHPFYEYVLFSDDDFFVRSMKEIEYFTEVYPSRIQRPFIYQASANTYREDKQKLLAAAGGKVFRLGVQSGSQRVLDEVYDRRISLEKTRRTINSLSEYVQRGEQELVLDFIVDNPYEEKRDILETCRFVINLPPVPMQLKFFHLVFFPGTPIFDRAVKDGLINPEIDTSFRKYSDDELTWQRNYVTFFLFLLRALRRRPFIRKISPLLLHFLISPPVRFLADIIPGKIWQNLFPIFKRQTKRKRSRQSDLRSRMFQREIPVKMVNDRRSEKEGTIA